ncbi:hypothetical protein DBR11_15165 [Pedobacter sp. HMWF019]|nr:hypothetical protein DBR11_15165 [Pedobacter sp. HMWF019]
MDADLGSLFFNFNLLLFKLGSSLLWAGDRPTAEFIREIGFCSQKKRRIKGEGILRFAGFFRPPKLKQP